MSIELWVCEHADAHAPRLRIPLDSTQHRTGDIWLVRVGADLAGQCYMLHAIGSTPAQVRHRFNPQQLVLDPYAPLVAAGTYGSEYRICIDTARAPPNDARPSDLAVVIRANSVAVAIRHGIGVA